ncbi:MAG: hypothetical protein WC156_10605, partial [Pedobacter sp.]
NLHVVGAIFPPLKADSPHGKGDGVFPPGLDFPDAEVFHDPKKEATKHRARYTADAANDRGDDPLHDGVHPHVRID